MVCGVGWYHYKCSMAMDKSKERSKSDSVYFIWEIRWENRGRATLVIFFKKKEGFFSLLFLVV